MPEIPELEAMRGVLNREVKGQKVAGAEVRIPVVIRRPVVSEFVQVLTGNTFVAAERRGKFIVLNFKSGHLLAVNLMLTGRLQLAGDEARPKKTSWLLSFANGTELRYFDQKLDGKVYLVSRAEVGEVPHFANVGPDALDPGLTFEMFAKKIRRYPGQVKRTLTNDAFISGIGNAYVDEILF